MIVRKQKVAWTFIAFLFLTQSTVLHAAQENNDSNKSDNKIPEIVALKFLGKPLNNPLRIVCEKHLTKHAEAHLRDRAPWELSNAAEKKVSSIQDQLQSLYADYALETAETHTETDSLIEAKYTAKFEALTHEMLNVLIEDRTQTLNAPSRFFLRRALATLHTRDLYKFTLGRLMGTVAGPHFNPVFNSIISPNNAPWRGEHNDFTEALVRFHEIQHARDRNNYPLQTAVAVYAFTKDMFNLFLQSPITPTIQFWTESRALGAQWEVVQRMPRGVRLVLKNKLRDQKYLSTTTSDKLNDILNLTRFHFRYGDDELTTLNEVQKNDLLYFMEFGHSILSSYDFTQENGGALFSDNELTQFKETNRVDLSKLIPLLEKIIIIKGLIYYSNGKTQTILQPLEEVLYKISIASLENADLSKAEFLVKLEEIHGYTYTNLLNNTYGPNGIKTWLYTVYLLCLASWAIGGADLTDLPTSSLHDLNYIAELIRNHAK